MMAAPGLLVSLMRHVFFGHPMPPMDPGAFNPPVTQVADRKGYGDGEAKLRRGMHGNVLMNHLQDQEMP